MWGRWVQIQYTLKSNTDAFWLHTVLEISDASNTSTSRKDKEINDGSWKCLSHQLLVCCLLTFIAITTITITSAHFDPLQVHRNRLLRSPCNNRIFTKIERIWGWSVFLLDPRTSCNRWNDSNEPTQKEKMPNTSKRCQELKFCITPWNSCASKAVHGLWDALPHIFFFSCHQALSNSSEQPASANTVARILPPPNTKPHCKQRFEGWESCTKAGPTHTLT